jgi:hypothetical protein
MVLILGGCGGDPSAPSVIVRDSANVVIVENLGPEWRAEERWRLSSDPVVKIGVLDGTEEYKFFRACSGLKLDDGRIVVANGGTGELRFFDPVGGFLEAVGRTGDGPSEFRDLQWVWRLRGDSLLAYDFFPGRLSLFDPQGRYVSMLQVVSPDGRQVFVLGPLEDGSLVVQGAPVWATAGVREGVFQDSVPVYRYSREGEVVDRLGVFPFTEGFRVETEAGWRMASLPFPRSPVRTAGQSEFVFGPAEEYELQIYAPSGELRRVVRVPEPRRPVTDEDVERFRERRLEALQEGEGGEATARLLRSLPVPEFMPPYERVLIDRVGYVWVAGYRATSDEPQIWRIFEPEGRYLGELKFPNELEVFEIGDDYLLGRWVDELEVEYVHLYELEKPGRSGQ